MNGESDDGPFIFSMFSFSVNLHSKMSGVISLHSVCLVKAGPPNTFFVVGLKWYFLMDEIKS